MGSSTGFTALELAVSFLYLTSTSTDACVDLFNIIFARANIVTPRQHLEVGALSPPLLKLVLVKALVKARN